MQRKMGHQQVYFYSCPNFSAKEAVCLHFQALAKNCLFRGLPLSAWLHASLTFDQHLPEELRDNGWHQVWL